MKELKLNQFTELDSAEMQQINGGCGEFWDILINIFKSIPAALKAYRDFLKEYAW